MKRVAGVESSSPQLRYIWGSKTRPQSLAKPGFLMATNGKYMVLCVSCLFSHQDDSMITRILSAMALLITASFVLAADDAPSKPDFQREVLPILRSHCVACHGPKKQEARIRLDNLSTDLINNRPAAENWHEVRNVLQAGEMPPEDAKQLTAKQRELLVRWVNAAISEALAAQRKTSGRVVLRRLNRVEYQNTMRDLLGLDMDYTRDLPPDPASSDGFKNNGRSLQMSGIQLEYYLDTARRALDRVIVTGLAPKKHEYKFPASNVKGWLRGVERSNRLQRKQEFLATMPKEYPEHGEYLVRVKMTAEMRPKTGFPLLQLLIGYRPDTQILFRETATVEIQSGKEQVHEFRGRLENHPMPVRGQGKFPGLVVRLRNAYDDGSPLPKADKKKKGAYPDEPQLSAINIESVEFYGPVYDEWPPELHRRILPKSELAESAPEAYVRDVLERFMSRAYRRPVDAQEVAGMVGFYKTIRPVFPSLEEAMRETLAFVLIRPDFLYLMEPAGDEKRPLGAWEFASRLSYFLWSTMPDEALSESAASGELLKPDVLKAQVNRMLSDPRSQRFVNSFTEQWLHLNVLDSVAVSKDYYPAFDESLKDEMRGETQSYFQELIRGDLSALNLLASDFAMLNESMAKHYGVEGVYGRDFRRVPLSESGREQHRGGLLGQASILLCNSTGEDSHAVRRAVWIRDRLLNDPPAPPPPDVPDLNPADPKFSKLTVREQLKIHRNTDSCRSCHRSIDPWGIALENFDAIGLWRTEVRRKKDKKFETQPVVASDVLPNGRELDGVASLKEYLVTDRRGDFARSLVSRLLSYALGRRLELSDSRAIDELSKAFSENDLRMRSLIHAIVQSEPFRVK